MRLMTHAPPATGHFRATIALRALSQNKAPGRLSAGLEVVYTLQPTATGANSLGAGTLGIDRIATFGRASATVGDGAIA